MLKNLIKPFNNRNAWGEDTSNIPLIVSIIIVGFLCSLGAIDCILSDDRSIVTSSVGVISVDYTNLSNEEIADKIKAQSNLSNINVEVHGESSSKYVIVTESNILLFRSTIYQDTVTFH